jgi:voltage-gated potassium channel
MSNINVLLGTRSDYMYFSFITLATVGYGDLTPQGGLGRALAVLEGLFGQIYLVTAVAALVGNLGRTR